MRTLRAQGVGTKGQESGCLSVWKGREEKGNGEKKRRNSNKGLSLLKTTRFIQRAGEVLGGWEGLAGMEAQGRAPGRQ